MFTSLFASVLLFLSIPVHVAAWSIPQSIVRTVYQFPTETWLENVAVRPSGELLITRIDQPYLYQIDPTPKQGGDSAPVLVHAFPNATSLLGITEYAPDQFALIAGNWSDTTFKTTPGSYSVWTVDVRGFAGSKDSAVVKKVNDISDGRFLNGMAYIPDTSIVLMSDSLGGSVFALDLNTAAYSVIAKDATMTPVAPYYIGINGLRLRKDPSTGQVYIYYTNTGTPVFTRLPLAVNKTTTPSTLHPSGPAEVLYTGFIGDDFTLDSQGNAFVTTDPLNYLWAYDHCTGNASIVLSNTNSTLIEGATSAAFGRTWSDKSTLYIVTNGGIVNPVGGTPEGGKVVAFDTTEVEKSFGKCSGEWQSWQ